MSATLVQTVSTSFGLLSTDDEDADDGDTASDHVVTAHQRSLVTSETMAMTATPQSADDVQERRDALSNGNASGANDSRRRRHQARLMVGQQRSMDDALDTRRHSASAPHRCTLEIRFVR